jgi:hypothetical protein
MTENDSDLISDLEDEDFYFDDLGRMVFTEAYHLKRGFYCESGCRHCPYQTGDSHVGALRPKSMSK